MEFKGRKEREVCYAARDGFFECHEQQPKGTDPATNKACKELYDKFERACGLKWTEHFLRKHNYLKFKNKLMSEGVHAVDSEKLKK